MDVSMLNKVGQARRNGVSAKRIPLDRKQKKPDSAGNN